MGNYSDLHSLQIPSMYPEYLETVIYLIENHHYHKPLIAQRNITKYLAEHIERQKNLQRKASLMTPF